LLNKQQIGTGEEETIGLKATFFFGFSTTIKTKTPSFHPMNSREALKLKYHHAGLDTSI
jgi:hypothetical protein